MVVDRLSHSSQFKAFEAVVNLRQGKDQMTAVVVSILKVKLSHLQVPHVAPAPVILRLLELYKRIVSWYLP